MIRVSPNDPKLVDVFGPETPHYFRQPLYRPFSCQPQLFFQAPI
jgi:hypothetical protein